MVLPADYTFASSDDSTASHSFNVTITKSTFCDITATDTVTSSITGTGLVQVIGGPATSLSLTLPPIVGNGVPFNATVKALDQFGNVASEYRGTVHFSSSDERRRCPPTTPSQDIGGRAVTTSTMG